MATRRVAQSDNISNDDIMGVLREFSDTPVTPAEIAGELGKGSETATAIFNKLTAMEDAGMVTGEGRGLSSKWSIGGETPAPKLTNGRTLRAGTSGAEVKPKRKRRTKAEMEAARAEAAKKNAYNARVAETQDMDMSQSAENALDVMAKGEAPSDEVNFPELRELLTLSAPETPAKPIPAVTPVKDEKGENITVPVDYDDPSKGRRELDASKGERVIGETTYKRLPDSTPLKGDAAMGTVTVIPSAASLLSEGQSLTLPAAPVVEPVKPRTVILELHEPKNGECPGNDIPECPEWCPVNVWELAHDANTESARKYWSKRVAQYQADAQPNYDANEDVPPF